MKVQNLIRLLDTYVHDLQVVIWDSFDTEYKEIIKVEYDPRKKQIILRYKGDTES